MQDSTKERRVSPPDIERGVYWAAATKGGKPEAFAVNSAGDEIERLTLPDYSWKRAEAAIEFLWRILDMKDPVVIVGRTRPTIVLPEPSPRRQPEIFDPYAEMGVPGHLRAPW